MLRTLTGEMLDRVTVRGSGEEWSSEGGKRLQAIYGYKKSCPSREEGQDFLLQEGLGLASGYLGLGGLGLSGELVIEAEVRLGEPACWLLYQ